MVATMKTTNRILIVSDDEAVRGGYLRSVNSVFPNSEFVSDGDGAMDAMQQQPFDVVLLDVWKSGFDGLEILRSIKRKWPESEVVVITGDPTVNSAKEAVRLGAYDYVAKPLAPQEVIGLAIGALTQKSWAMHRLPEIADIAERCGASVEAAHRSGVNGRETSFRGRKES